jgi:hypothetical protein
VHLVAKGAHAVVAARVMQHHEAGAAGRHVRGHQLVVVALHHLQVRGAASPLRQVHAVERRVQYELRVAGSVLAAGAAEVQQLVNGGALTDDDECHRSAHLMMQQNCVSR